MSDCKHPQIFVEHVEEKVHGELELHRSLLHCAICGRGPTVGLPMHTNLTIEHQPHVSLYETVEQWRDNGGPDEQAVLEVDRAEMLATGQVWRIQWYPVTPIGHFAVYATTLQRALELAAEQGRQDGERRINASKLVPPTIEILSRR